MGLVGGSAGLTQIRGFLPEVLGSPGKLPLILVTTFFSFLETFISRDSWLGSDYGECGGAMKKLTKGEPLGTRGRQVTILREKALD